MPRLIARSIVSFGMFCAFASETALRSRAFESGSPEPPVFVATVISLIIFVKILPRLASSAPFLCLIVCHLECPNMRDAEYHGVLSAQNGCRNSGNISVTKTVLLENQHPQG